MIERVKKWLLERKLSGKVYKVWEHKGWGNRISVDGHYAFNGHGVGMHSGAELRCRMQSGKVGRYLVTEVRYCQDPPDQFFGEMEPLGYAEGDVKGDKLGYNGLVHVGPQKWELP